ncbi:MAG: oligosaccharide flippase family protein [Bacteroidetes bacterium]|nr:oligosaccharide flippase family protein [Bacteroidota bacterium]
MPEAENYWSLLNKSMSLLRKSIDGFFWNHLGKITDIGLTYLLSLIIARMMVPHDYGGYVATMSIAALLILIVSGGFDDTLVKYVSQYNAEKKYQNIRSLTLFLFKLRTLIILIVCIIFYFFKDEIKVIFNNPYAAKYAVYIISYISFQSFINFLSSYFIAHFKTALIFFINFLSRLTTIGITVVLLYSGYGLLELLTLYSIIGVLTFFVLIIFLNKSLSKEKGELEYQSVLSFSISIYFNSIIALLLGKYAGILLLSHHLGAVSDVAYFDIGYSLEVMIESLFALGFTGIGLSVASELATKDKSKLHYARKIVIQYFQLVIIPVSIFCILFAEKIITLLYSDKYLAAAPVFRTFLSINIIAVALFARDFNATILFSLKQENKVLAVRLCIGILSVIINYLFIPYYKIVGAIAVIGSSFVLSTIIEYYLASYYIGYTYDYVFLLKISISSFIAVSCIVLLSSSITSIILLSLIYLCLLGVCFGIFKIYKTDLIQIIFRHLNFKIL